MDSVKMTELRSFKAISVNTFWYKVWLVNNNIKVLGPLIGHQNLYLSIIVHVYEVFKINFAQDFLPVLTYNWQKVLIGISLNNREAVIMLPFGNERVNDKKIWDGVYIAAGYNSTKVGHCFVLLAIQTEAFVVDNDSAVPLKI
jgi:hypothetical protein